MRLKIAKDNKEFSCCFCFHVRSGTILFGIWNLIVQLIGIGLLVVYLIRPDVLVHNNQSVGDKVIATYDLDAYDSGTSPEGPRYMAETDLHRKGNLCHNLYYHVSKRKHSREDKAVAFLVLIGYTILTMMLIYGAAKGRPGYLMPFFCIQVFDFCISLLTMIGYMTYMPDDCQWHDHIPEAYRCDFLKDSQTRMIVVMSAVVIVMFIKAYFIGVVWACYKYLAIQKAAQSVSRYMDTEAEPMLMPPKYEEVIKEQQENAQQPPPAYTS